MSDDLTASTAAPAVSDPDVAGAPEPRPAPEMEAALLGRLLGIADAHRAQNHLHQALELYFGLVGSHLHTPQGEQAFQRLMGIAAGYERAGEPHQARNIYERLLRK